MYPVAVRSNLDPFDGVDSDLTLWEVLRQAGLDQAVKSMDVRPKPSALSCAVLLLARISVRSPQNVFIFIIKNMYF